MSWKSEYAAWAEERRKVAARQERVTKAGQWFSARQRGERLPQNILPEEVDDLLAARKLEQQP